ncbi:MAG: penicillin acylase family protein [Chitinophagaceae bacterium]
MRIVPFLISTAATVGLVLALNHRWTVGGNKTPRLGNFLSPQQGFWQNAEARDESFSIDLKSPLLLDKVDVYLDERLVPHVFAQNEHDVYFVQGFLHAKFRLWQMEFQTHAAAGRLCELLGRMKGDISILDRSDRKFRRLGMGWAAEKSLVMAEENPDSKAVLDAYRDGVNAYIEKLKPEDYPVEYKLLDYAPEKWTNLKTILFTKYMAFDLAGFEEDFELTNAKSFLTKTQFEKVYPYGQDSTDPIIPKGTVFEKPGILLKIPAGADSVYAHFSDSTGIVQSKPDSTNGSNNWAVAGSKTASGKPILCGDPHLGLNLPSIWFEMQLHTPQWNVYGASFPGAPAIPIGFNDSIAWSETNGMRDVRDYYAIKFKDASQKEYWFDSAWKTTEWRIDTIKVLGEPNYIDSIPMTVFGPVMYEKRYGNKLKTDQAYAVRWKAHDPSNEAWIFVKMARAKDYIGYLEAIKSLDCPGQNVVFASKSGDIAMWCQGAFPAKWRRQGDFVMPGEDSSYMWQGIIPMNENPHMINPVRGFVSSANQLPVDINTYPYYLGGNYDLYRGITINRKLAAMDRITPQDMERMQTNNYNLSAATALPLLLKYLPDSSLQPGVQKYAGILRNWNYRADPEETGPTVYARLLHHLEGMVWDDDVRDRSDLPLIYPNKYTLMEALLKDTAFQFVDNRNTTGKKETLRELVLASMNQAAQDLDSMQAAGMSLNHAKAKATEVDHLLKLMPFSRTHLPIGGGTNIINATTENHGPSWRMIVSLTDKTEAYGVYPGGQNGNPGSKFYDNFIDTWAAGQYYSLWVMTDADYKDPKVKWSMHFSKG